MLEISFNNSWAFQEVLLFLEDIEAIKLQALSRWDYEQNIPRCSLKRHQLNFYNALFYDQGQFFQYDCISG